MPSCDVPALVHLRVVGSTAAHVGTVMPSRSPRGRAAPSSMSDEKICARSGSYVSAPSLVQLTAGSDRERALVAAVPCCVCQCLWSASIRPMKRSSRWRGCPVEGFLASANADTSGRDRVVEAESSQTKVASWSRSKSQSPSGHVRRPWTMPSVATSGAPRSSRSSVQGSGMTRSGQMLRADLRALEVRQEVVGGVVRCQPRSGCRSPGRRTRGDRATRASVGTSASSRCPRSRACVGSVAVVLCRALPDRSRCRSTVSMRPTVAAPRSAEDASCGEVGAEVQAGAADDRVEIERREVVDLEDLALAERVSRWGSCS